MVVGANGCAGLGLAPCERCGKRTLQLLESRKNPKAGSRRKRYKCVSCDYRVTRYEVSDAFYTQAINNERIIHQLKLYIDSMSGELVKSSKTCSNCEYNEGNKCSFDVPEYDSDDSDDCTYWRIKTCRSSPGVSQSA